MENDAFSAGVLHGGLYNTADIKVLICYILSAIGEPIPANSLVNLLHTNGMANGFEVSDAIASLEKNGQIKVADAEDDAYIVTPAGEEIAATLGSTLSVTVKNRAYDLTLKMLTKYKNAKDTVFEITRENGKSYISCTALDGKAPFFAVKMLLPDESGAEHIKENFLQNSGEIFSTLIEKLTK